MTKEINTISKWKKISTWDIHIRNQNKAVHGLSRWFSPRISNEKSAFAPFLLTI